MIPDFNKLQRVKSDVGIFLQGLIRRLGLNYLFEFDRFFSSSFVTTLRLFLNDVQTIPKGLILIRG